MKRVCIYGMLIGLIALFSCKKTQTDNETSSVTGFAQVSQEFLQVFMEIDHASMHQKGLFYPYSAGPTYIGRTDSLSGDTTYNSQGEYTDTLNLPTLWIRYNNYSGPDGKTRNGTIKVVYSKRYDWGAASAKVNFLNYTSNSVAIQGSLFISRNANSFTLQGVNTSINNGKSSSVFSFIYDVKTDDNGTIGNETDDHLEVSGNGNGVNQNGKKYTAEVIEPIKKRADCAWVSGGKVTVTPDGLHGRNVDFGNGNCDDVASFVLDSQTFTVHLSK